MFIDIFMGIFKILHLIFSFFKFFVIQNLCRSHIEVAYTTQREERQREEKRQVVSCLSVVARRAV
jgi:hypothetical protein